MGACGIVALAVVLIGSLKPNRSRPSAAATTFDMRLLQRGVPLKVQSGGVPVFLLRPTREQLASIDALTPHVWHPEVQLFVPELDAFVYAGVSTHVGCPLEVKPAGPSVLTEDRAATAGPATWLGGYADPNCDSSYDFAGRTIKSWQYTFNGFNADFPNLHGVRIWLLNEHDIQIDAANFYRRDSNRIEK